MEWQESGWRRALQTALKIAGLLGEPGGNVLRVTARQAFTAAVSRAALSGAMVAAAACLAALTLLPGQGKR
jgi:hypothetical protein